MRTVDCEYEADRESVRYVICNVVIHKWSVNHFKTLGVGKLKLQSEKTLHKIGCQHEVKKLSAKLILLNRDVAVSWWVLDYR